MKAWFRRNGDEVRTAWDDAGESMHAVDMLVAMTRAVTKGNAFGWFERAMVV